MTTAAVDNVEVMFVPTDAFDLPRIVSGPGGPPNGMQYLGPFLPNTSAVPASNAYRLTLRLISQFPGWIAPVVPVKTSSLIVAQPIVVDPAGLPIPSPRQSDSVNLGVTMNDWIDRPPPGGPSAIGSWTFEQTRGPINHPDVTFTFEFALENDPRLLTIDATLGDDYDQDIGSDFDYVTGTRSYTVALTEGSTSTSVADSHPGTSVHSNQYNIPRPPVVIPAARSFSTSDPTGTLCDLIVNVRWIDNNLFVVITPKDFGDPAVPVNDTPFGR